MSRRPEDSSNSASDDFASSERPNKSFARAKVPTPEDLAKRPQEARDFVRAFASRIYQNASAYDVLGVSPALSLREIRKAFTDIGKKFHPSFTHTLTDQALKKAVDEIFANMTAAFTWIENEKKGVNQRPFVLAYDKPSISLEQPEVPRYDTESAELDMTQLKTGDFLHLWSEAEGHFIFWITGAEIVVKGSKVPVLSLFFPVRPMPFYWIEGNIQVNKELAINSQGGVLNNIYFPKVDRIIVSKSAVMEGEDVFLEPEGKESRTPTYETELLNAKTIHELLAILKNLPLEGIVSLKDKKGVSHSIWGKIIVPLEDLCQKAFVYSSLQKLSALIADLPDVLNIRKLVTEELLFVQSKSQEAWATQDIAEIHKILEEFINLGYESVPDIENKRLRKFKLGDTYEIIGGFLSTGSAIHNGISKSQAEKLITITRNQPSQFGIRRKIREYIASITRKSFTERIFGRKETKLSESRDQLYVNELKTSEFLHIQSSEGATTFLVVSVGLKPILRCTNGREVDKDVEGVPGNLKVQLDGFFGLIAKEGMTLTNISSITTSWLPHLPAEEV